MPGPTPGARDQNQGPIFIASKIVLNMHIKAENWTIGSSSCHLKLHLKI